MKQSAMAATSRVSGDQRSPGPPNSCGGADAVSTTAYDATTNHLDGTLMNGPLWVNSAVPWRDTTPPSLTCPSNLEAKMDAMPFLEELERTVKWSR